MAVLGYAVAAVLAVAGLYAAVGGGAACPSLALYAPPRAPPALSVVVAYDGTAERAREAALVAALASRPDLEAILVRVPLRLRIAVARAGVHVSRSVEGLERDEDGALDDGLRWTSGARIVLVRDLPPPGHDWAPLWDGAAEPPPGVLAWAAADLRDARPKAFAARDAGCFARER